MNDRCYRLSIPEQIFVRKYNILYPKEQVLLDLKFLLQVLNRPCDCSRQNDLLNAGYVYFLNITL